MTGFNLIRRASGVLEIEVRGEIVGRVVIRPDPDGEDDDEILVTNYSTDTDAPIDDPLGYSGTIFTSQSDAWDYIHRTWKTEQEVGS